MLWASYLDNDSFTVALGLLNAMFVGDDNSPFFRSFEGYRASYDYVLSPEQADCLRKHFPLICPYSDDWKRYYLGKLRTAPYFNLGLYACPIFRQFADVIFNADQKTSLADRC